MEARILRRWFKRLDSLLALKHWIDLEAWGYSMVKRIDTIQLPKLLEKGVVIVDVREKDETQSGQIPGGINWPLSTFGNREKDFLKEKSFLFYCSSGLRSVVAAELAEQWTCSEVYSLDGGFRDYLENGMDK